MASEFNTMLPAQLVTEVEMFVDERHRDAAKSSNTEVLDENGVFVLHMLAARLYAAGWKDGGRAEAERINGALRRQREADRVASASGSREADHG